AGGNRPDGLNESVTDLGGKTCIFSHPVYLFLREFSLQDSRGGSDNNAAERALRAVCLGKKNYVFFGSDHGGERGALLYGLIGTCRLNGIDPEAYLRHILSVLPEWPSNRVDELLPWNVVLTNK
ncbi:TPA: transposase domain-containing protein, partial [Escherichia coli]